MSNRPVGRTTFMTAADMGNNSLFIPALGVQWQLPQMRVLEHTGFPQEYWSESGSSSWGRAAARSTTATAPAA